MSTPNPNLDPDPKAGSDPVGAIASAIWSGTKTIGNHLLGGIVGAGAGVTGFFGALNQGFGDGYWAEGNGRYFDGQSLVGLGGAVLYGLGSLITFPFTTLYGAYKGLTGGLSAAGQVHTNTWDKGGFAKTLFKGIGKAALAAGTFMVGGVVGALKLITRPVAGAVGLVTGFTRGLFAGPAKLLVQGYKDAWRNAGSLWGAIKFLGHIPWQPFKAALGLAYNIFKPFVSVFGDLPDIANEPGPWKQALKGGAYGLQNGFEGGNVFVSDTIFGLPDPGKEKSFRTTIGELLSGRAGDGIPKDVGKVIPPAPEPVKQQQPAQPAQVAVPHQHQQQLAQVNVASHAASRQLSASSATAGPTSSYTPGASLASSVAQVVVQQPQKAKRQIPSVGFGEDKPFATAEVGIDKVNKWINQNKGGIEKNTIVEITVGDGGQKKTLSVTYTGDPLTVEQLKEASTPQPAKHRPG